ncbi:MAG: hypothetical protein WCP85_26825 [Mariniphaga sp.]
MVKFLKDWKIIDLGGRKLEVVFNPGTFSIKIWKRRNGLVMK